MAALETETSTEARVIRVVFDDERDFILRDFNWPFARKIADLGLIDGSEDEAVNNFWQYAYQYPSDCLLARRLVTVAGRVTAIPPPFEVGVLDNAQVIYTDLADAQLEYTRTVTDPSRFDPIFRSALSWKIAGSVAAPLSRVKDIATYAMQNYAIEISKAQARALSEGQQDDPAESEFFRARE